MLTAAKPMTLSIAERLSIDQLCLHFEQSLQNGAPDSIEQHLSDVAENLQPVLLEELLHLELPYCYRQGQTPRKIDYLHRFAATAQHQQIIDRVWAQIAHDLAPVANQPAGPRIPGFTLLERIASGGMGVVYKARDDKLKRIVAIKMLTGDTP